MRRILLGLRRLLFGQPIATDALTPVTLRTRLALPVFGAGMLSAVAYAPDAVVDALRRGAQQGAIPYMAVGVVLIMLLLGFAYRANVRARPDGLGDYGTVRDLLGRRWGVVTGASLLIDYLFTVAVSVAAVTQIFVYLVPVARPWAPLIAVGLIGVMTLVALRVIRDRVRVVLTVWFGFLVVLALMFVFGVARHGADTASPIAANAPTTWTVILAYAGAIASGAVMVTGIEHLASAAPHHAEPRGRRAGRTLLIAVVASAAGFLAVAMLAWLYRITGWADGPILLQTAQEVFRRPFVLWFVALSAVAILWAAANAVFRRFSILASSLAKDAYLPRQLSMKNDRLVVRGGILAIALPSAVMVAATSANVEQLVHMYVVGAFTAIVLSQVAMVRRCSDRLQLATVGRERRALAGERVLHGTAAGVAAAVLIVVAVFNFINGAWVAIALIALLVTMMHAINRHYAAVRSDVTLTTKDLTVALPSATHGVVLVAQLHRPAMRALAYAKAARHSSLKALGVRMDAAAARELQERWGAIDAGVPLVIVDSPYRDLIAPVMDYVRSIHRASPRDVVVVYVPEYIVGRWWERALHNKATKRLRAQLLELDSVVVSAVPWHLESVRDRRAAEEAPPTPDEQLP
ncbi:APC family permease [Demequina sp. NBRC 110053]|uniref:APC family permease n=1 Tax=Demequina sp. NBRC 110053 TaxID=1570342 RepID=UPI000A05514F|nr:APC family permease [Demequina sp. NBRC 110053]